MPASVRSAINSAVGAVLIAMSPTIHAQNDGPKTPDSLTSHSESSAPALHLGSTQDLVDRFTPQQKRNFDAAGKASRAKQYAEAFTLYKQLLDGLPGDVVLLKFASEAALNAGDTSYALNILKRVSYVTPDDWQAAGLLTRACAETGDKPCRDSGIAHMLELRSRGVTPGWLEQYLVERLKVGSNDLFISTSLAPWGRYKVYASGKVFDAQGKMFLQTSIESNDADQPSFAREHPEEASKGIRRFSLDAYRVTGLNSNGQRTQTHYTYKFFAGQPTYETIRDEFVKITGGTTRPISSRSGLIVP